MKSSKVRIAAVLAAGVLVTVGVLSQMGGDDTPQAADPQDGPTAIMPANPSRGEVTTDPTVEVTVDPTDAPPGVEELQEPGDNHDHALEGQDEVLSGIREPTPAESAAMTAVSAYMRMDTTESTEHRRARLSEWFTEQSGHPRDPLPPALTQALEGIMDSRSGHVTTLSQSDTDATVEIGLLRNMVLTLNRDEPPTTVGGNMVFTVDVRQVDGEWLVHSFSTST